MIDFQLFSNLIVIVGLALIYQKINDQSLNTPSSNLYKQPLAWINGKSKSYKYLSHVKDVFTRLGYRTHLADLNNTDWKVLWNHEYPFLQPDLLEKIKSMKSSQKVNHVPGSSYITSKVHLAQTRSIGIPLAFSLPDKKQQFLEYSTENPNVMWVQKSNAHRGIEVVQPDQLDLDRPDTFIQRFIDNPLLIDDRKFDLGIYVVLTSLHPLRVYFYDADILLRFCTIPYNPFNASNVDQYVVGDDYTPIWEMPSFNKFYNEQQLTFKASFQAYLIDNKIDPDKIWLQIKKIIREVFELNNAKMRFHLLNYKNPTSFFELIRFDFLIDSDYKVYLMEANMSPNLSSGHFKPNALLYEQVLMNVFSLVGLSRHLNEIQESELKTSEVEVSSRDLSVNMENCDECSNKECALSLKCMGSNLLQHLRHAFIEHLNRRNMRRVVPSSLDQFSEMTTLDKLQRQWFDLMCKKDRTFCT